MWSGRYATPKNEKAWTEEEEAFAALDPPTTPAGALTHKEQPIPCGWLELDRSI